MDVQGAIIEKLSGQTLPEFMRTRIFEPLGMVDTAFHTPPPKKAHRRLASLYRWSPTQQKPGGVAQPILGRDYDAPPALANGGGGLVSTVGRLRELRPDAAERRRAGRQAHRQRRGAEACR